MSRWHAIRIRDDLYRAVQAQAAQQSRSTTGQLDFILARALEQERYGLEADGSLSGPPGAGPSPARASAEEADGGPGAGTSHRPAPSSVAPARTIDGQTTVDEMLASCPNCAGNFVQRDSDGVEVCADCGYVRESGA